MRHLRHLDGDGLKWEVLGARESAAERYDAWLLEVASCLLE